MYISALIYVYDLVISLFYQTFFTCNNTLCFNADEFKEFINRKILYKKIMRFFLNGGCDKTRDTILNRRR